MRTLFLFTLVLLINIKAFSQKIGVISNNIHLNGKNDIKPLKIGDKVPDFLFEKMINYKYPNAKISDFKGRLIIMDFWATYCSTCIEGMPRNERFQKQFGDKIQFLLVNDQPSASNIVPKFWVKNNITKNINLPVIIDDLQFLMKYFPRDQLGQQVWIDGDRIFRASTSAQYVNEDNINRILSGADINLPVFKQVENYNFENTLLSLQDNGAGKPNYAFYSTISPYIPNILKSSRLSNSIDTIAGTQKLTALNVSIIALYAYSLKQCSFKDFIPNRIILEVKDSAKYFYNKEKEYFVDWNMKNSFCYETVAPIQIPEATLLKYMQLDLNKFLDLNGRIEKRNINCLELVIESDTSRLHLIKKAIPNDYDSYGNRIHKGVSTMYYSINEFLRTLNNAGNPIILDGTNIKSNEIFLEIFFSKPDGKKLIKSPHDLQGYINQLKEYGLNLIPVQKEIEVFVLSENN